MLTLTQVVIELEPKLTNKKLIVFGAGKGGKFVISTLRVLGLSIEFCLDNDISKYGETVLGVEIRNPKDLKELLSDSIVIIIGSIYFEEIAKQLDQMGFQENVHYFNGLRQQEVKANQRTRTERTIHGVTVGKYTYGADQFCFPGTLLKHVGAFTSINEHVLIGMRNHPTSLISTHPFLYRKKEQLGGIEGVPFGFLDEYGGVIIDEYSSSKNEGIIIGSDVWIGAGAIVLPSVTIGNGVIIGAGALVNKDVPDYAVVGGVPAKIIKYRFNSEEIDILNKVQWWNWSDHKIVENADILKDPSKFFENFK